MKRPDSASSAHPNLQRREFLQASSGGVFAAAAVGLTTGASAAPDDSEQDASAKAAPIRRIATEEAFTTPAIIAATNHYMAGPGAAEEPTLAAFRKALSPAIARSWGQQLADLGDLRRQEMDAARIDTQILVVSSPGVQIFPPDQAAELARDANEAAAALHRRDPRRYAALAAIAPQDPKGAADELTRGVRHLGCRGALINSHTKGEYLDNPKFWPILEAAQSLDVPIYLHPREPAPAMAAPYADLAMTGSIWGFAAETGLHALRMILGQVFDNFPKLQIILGHAGEALPYFVDRIDTRFAVELAPSGAKPLRHKPSHYLRNNFIVTTSGMNWNDPIRHCLSVMGKDRVMFAADWPFEDAAAAVRTFDATRLDAATARQVYELNARRIFRLDA